MRGLPETFDVTMFGAPAEYTCSRVCWAWDAVAAPRRVRRGWQLITVRSYHGPALPPNTHNRAGEAGKQ